MIKIFKEKTVDVGKDEVNEFLDDAHKRLRDLCGTRRNYVKKILLAFVKKLLGKSQAAPQETQLLVQQHKNFHR